MIFFVRAEVTIGVAILPDLLPLEGVRVSLWRPNRLPPPSNADRSANGLLALPLGSAHLASWRGQQRALPQRGRRRQESQNGSDTQRAHQ